MKTIFLLITTIFFLQETPVPVMLGESFVVEKTDVAIYKDANINVRVLKIADSRCPVNTNCVWAGELAVEVEVNGNGVKSINKLVMPALGKAGARSVTAIGAYQLHFEGESPKRINKEIVKDAGEMKLTFKLVRLE